MEGSLWWTGFTNFSVLFWSFLSFLFFSTLFLGLVTSHSATRCPWNLSSPTHSPVAHFLSLRHQPFPLVCSRLYTVLDSNLAGLLTCSWTFLLKPAMSLLGVTFAKLRHSLSLCFSLSGLWSFELWVNLFLLTWSPVLQYQLVCLHLGLIRLPLNVTKDVTLHIFLGKCSVCWWNYGWISLCRSVDLHTNANMTDHISVWLNSINCAAIR